MIHFWLSSSSNIRSKVYRIYEERYVAQINTCNRVYNMGVIIDPVLPRGYKSDWLAPQEEVCTIFANEEQRLIE